jgi:leucine-zipper-like transcriptional regulator 1
LAKKIYGFFIVASLVFGFSFVLTGCPNNSPSSPAPVTVVELVTSTYTTTPTPGTPTVTPTSTISPSVGRDWYLATSSAPLSMRDGASAVSFGGSIYVIGGEVANDSASQLNSVVSSTNGSSWSVVNSGGPPSSTLFSARNSQTSLVFNGLMWVIAGWGPYWNNDAWSSSDGNTWTQVNAGGTPSSTLFSARGSFGSVVFNGDMWVIAGNGASGLNSDVWYSNSGTSWTEAAGSAAFGGRTNFQALVYNGKIWVIGGSNGTLLNDVWYSSNGSTWTEATSSAAFSPREFFGAIVFDNLMWVFGGDSYVTDAWYSSDGANWTEVVGSGAYDGRQSYPMVVFNNKMFIIGGYNSTDSPSGLNDVWYSP